MRKRAEKKLLNAFHNNDKNSTKFSGNLINSLQLVANCTNFIRCFSYLNVEESETNLIGFAVCKIVSHFNRWMMWGSRAHRSRIHQQNNQTIDICYVCDSCVSISFSQHLFCDLSLGIGFIISIVPVLLFTAVNCRLPSEKLVSL